MLTIRLKPGDRIQIGDDITVVCKQESRGSKTWLQVDAPRDIPITRAGEVQAPDWPPEA